MSTGSQRPAGRRPAGRTPARRTVPRKESFVPPAIVGPLTWAQCPLAIDPAGPIGTIQTETSTLHPLIFRKRIAKVDGVKPGEMAAVYGPEGTLLGYGLYNPRSEIGVRMVFPGTTFPGESAWHDKLAAAVTLRRGLLKLDHATNAYRLIHSEADGMSGLMIDRYADVLSAEVFSVGMYQRAEAVLKMLAPMCEAKHWSVRPSPQFLSQEGGEPPTIASPSMPDQVVIQEFGTRFRVRFAGGHKTGFFCDQRENRKRLAEFCQGRTVLDLCCYSGGFAIQAKKLGHATEVVGVDLDEEPLALARENANLNQVRIRFVQSDAFIYIRDMLQTGRQFDVVVLDPPKLIRNRAELEDGTKKHFDLNRLAMRLVRPGGMFLTCCCSGLLQEADFMRLLVNASYQAGPLISPATEEQGERHAARPMQILARTGAAPDHPVAAGVPETEYLKAVWIRLG